MIITVFMQLLFDGIQGKENCWKARVAERKRAVFVGDFECRLLNIFLIFKAELSQTILTEMNCRKQSFRTKL